jgi:hypothetical protein
LTDGEGAIAALPGEVPEGVVAFLEPQAGAAFQIANEIAEGKGLRQNDEEMDMVRHATDAEGFPAMVGDEAAEVVMEFGA